MEQVAAPAGVFKQGRARPQLQMRSRACMVFHFMSRILLGVTGSIAAYKAADLASLLTKEGHSVTCVLTKEALEFVTPLTLRTLSKNPVITDLFAEKEGWQPGHIQLADEALYDAKGSGRNRCVIMDKEYSELATGSFKSRTALAEG